MMCRQSGGDILEIPGVNSGNENGLKTPVNQIKTDFEREYQKLSALDSKQQRKIKRDRKSVV